MSHLRATAASGSRASATLQAKDLARSLRAPAPPPPPPAAGRKRGAAAATAAAAAGDENEAKSKTSRTDGRRHAHAAHAGSEGEAAAPAASAPAPTAAPESAAEPEHAGGDDDPFAGLKSLSSSSSSAPFSSSSSGPVLPVAAAAPLVAAPAADGEAVLAMLRSGQTRALFMGHAKRVTSEEKYSGEEALRAMLLNKNVRLLAYEDHIRKTGSAGGGGEELRQREVHAAFASAATKHAVSAGAGASMMAQLSRDNAALKRELAQLAEAASTAAAAAAQPGDDEGAAASAAAALQAADLRVAAAEKATHDAEERLRTATELQAQGEAAAVASAAHAARNLDALRAKHEAQCEQLRAEARRSTLAAAAAARREAEEEAGAILASQQRHWTAMRTETDSRAARETAASTTAAAAELAGERARAAAELADERARAAAELVGERARAAAAAAAAEAAAAASLAAEQARTAAAVAAAEMQRTLYEAADRRRLALAEELCVLKGSIRVFVRVRPALPNEVATPSSSETPVPLFHYPHSSTDATDIELVERPGTGTGGYGVAAEGRRHAFTAQRIYTPTSRTVDVFDEVEILVQSALNGHRATIFAYGQTGSGKTHTMQGCSAEPGLIPMASRYLFDRAAVMRQQGWTTTISIEILEVYNEQIRDLLANGAGVGGATLEIKHKDDAPYVVGLSQVEAASPEAVAALLARAAGARAVGSTQMNEHSSRSHLLVALRVSSLHAASAQHRAGVLNLVDLAGSERLARSGAEGERLKETQSINKSLSALSTVVLQLQSKSKHVSYRDSKLTHILQASLAPASARTLLIATLAPGHDSAAESLSTLKFAQLAAAVVRA